MKRSLRLFGLAVALGMGSAQAAVSISGAVKDTSGKVLDSVRLSLSVPGGATIARDTTGADGVFRIVSDSTQGKLVLRATSMGSVSYTTKSDTIVLSGKDTSGVEIRMVPVPVPVKSSVSGKIDSAGSATVISGAIVTLRGTGGGATTLRDTTGDDGAYSFAGVTTGVYTLSVSANGYAAKSVTDIVKADPKTLNVSLAAIVVSTVSGKIDSAGSAKMVSGAVVTLRGTGTGAATLRDTTGDDGAYSFAGVTAGVYTLSVSANGYAAKSVTDTVKADPKTLNVSLVAIVLSTVSGKIDSAGSAKMVSGAVVTLRGTGAGAATLRDTTGDDGAYSFSGVTAGVYTLSVSANGYTAKSVTDTVKADPKTLNVSLAAIVVSTVSGKVDSAGSAKMVSGAVVTLRGTGAGAATLRDTTGDDGAYSFAGVTAGVYTLSVSANGYTAKSVTDTVKADPKTLNVSLVATVPVKTIRISGSVSDSTGKKMDSVYVALRSTGAQATTVSRDTTDAKGAFDFTTTSASGKYVLRLIDLRSPVDTLVDTITLDSADFSKDIVWKKKPHAAVGSRNGAAAQTISFDRGVLVLAGMQVPGTAKVFDAKGRLVFQRAFLGGDRVGLWLETSLAKGSYLVGVSQGAAMVRGRILVK